MSTLSGLRDKLQSGRQSLGKRIFKRGQGKAAGASPSKDTLKNTVHVSGAREVAASALTLQALPSQVSQALPVQMQ